MICSVKLLLALSATALIFVQGAPMWSSKPNTSHELNIPIKAEPDYISDRWKADKLSVNQESMDSLRQHQSAEGIAAEHRLMNRWKDYHSREGRRFDPDGRRKLSATQRAELLKKVHDDVHSYLFGEGWSGYSLSEMYNKAQEDYEAARNQKKSDFRTKYAAYVKHIWNGGKPGDIPFISSKDAKGASSSS